MAMGVRVSMGPCHGRLGYLLTTDRGCRRQVWMPGTQTPACSRQTGAIAIARVQIADKQHLAWLSRSTGASIFKELRRPDASVLVRGGRECGTGGERADSARINQHDLVLAGGRFA